MMSHRVHSTHAFADESKQAAYILAVCEIPTARAGEVRAEIVTISRAIDRLPVHCQSLRPAERMRFVELMPQILHTSVTLFISNAKYRSRGRQDCLERAVGYLVERAAHSLTLERDETLERSDRAIIHRYLERERRLGTLEYGHQTAREQPCLVIPDVVAWHWQRGGPERTRIRPFIRAVIHA